MAGKRQNLGILKKIKTFIGQRVLVFDWRAVLIGLGLMVALALSRMFVLLKLSLMGMWSVLTWRWWFYKAFIWGWLLGPYLVGVLVGWLVKKDSWKYMLLILFLDVVAGGVWWRALEVLFGSVWSVSLNDLIYQPMPFEYKEVVFELVRLVGFMLVGGWSGESLAKIGFGKKTLVELQRNKEVKLFLALFGVMFAVLLTTRALKPIKVPGYLWDKAGVTQQKQIDLDFGGFGMEPYTELKIEKDQLVYEFEGNREVLVTGLPDRIVKTDKVMVGPDGRSVHILFNPYVYSYSFEVIRDYGSCLDLSKAKTLPVDYGWAAKEAKCVSSGIMSDGGFLAVKTEVYYGGSSIQVALEHVDGEGARNEYLFRGLSLDKQEQETLGSVESATDSATAYYFPSGYSAVLNSNDEDLIVLFGDRLVWLDKSEKEVKYFLTLPDEFPVNTVQVLSYHPSLPLAVLGTGWEGVDIAKYVLDYSSGEVEVVQVPAKLAFELSDKSKWSGGLIWRGSEMEWTENGFGFTVYEEKSFYGWEKGNELCSQVGFDNFEAREEQENEEMGRLEQEYEVGGVVCSICGEGPGSGFGCVGLVEEETYGYDLGGYVFELLEKNEWSGESR